MFFESWQTIFEVTAVTIAAYAALVVILRVTGKRTLSKWNAFDFVVTVAFGSTLATTILTPEVTWSEGVTGLALLAALQFLVTWLNIRSETLRKLTKSRPTLLLYQGEYQHDLMRKERVSISEVHAALRAKGYGSADEVDAIVLETDGSFSVIGTIRADTLSTLDGVRGLDPALTK